MQNANSNAEISCDERYYFQLCFDKNKKEIAENIKITTEPENATIAIIDSAKKTKEIEKVKDKLIKSIGQQRNIFWLSALKDPEDRGSKMFKVMLFCKNFFELCDLFSEKIPNEEFKFSLDEFELMLTDKITDKGDFSLDKYFDEKINEYCAKKQLGDITSKLNHVKVDEHTYAEFDPSKLRVSYNRSHSNH